MSPTRLARRAWVTHRTAVVALTALLVVVVGGGVAAAARGDAGSYRTTTAERGDVDEVLDLTGTIAASNRRDLAFGQSGTVDSVDVEAGDEVAPGDVLAALDTTDLEADVTRAEQDLADAEAAVEDTEDSQTSVVTQAAGSTGTTQESTGAGTSGPGSSSTGSSSTGSSGTTSSGTGADPALTKALATLTKQQVAVRAAQSRVSTATAAATAALTAQQEACSQTPESDDTGADDPGTDETGTDDTGTDETGTEGTGTTAQLSEECSTALVAVQDQQSAVSDAQTVLSEALGDLAGTLTTAVAAVTKAAGSGSGTPSTDSSSPSGTTQQGSSPASGASAGASTSSGAASGGSATSSATSLASRQAAVDVAEAALAEAQAAVQAATLTAPFAGTVLSVDVATGDDASSGTTAIVVVGAGETTVTTSATVDQVPSLEVGQTASVTAAGASEPVTATVSSIGLLPATSDSGSTTYPVTLVLDGTVAAPEGSPADVALITRTESDVVTVPTSAITTGERSTVTVLDDGVPRRVEVGVGAVGTTRTAVTDGLEAGQEVVIADLDAALPSDDDASLSSVNGRGGFPGGGPPSGMQGGRPGR